MKKPNLQLKQLALSKVDIQLANLQQQLAALQAKTAFVLERYNAKLEEKSQIETVIVSIQTDTAVSE